MPVTQDRERSKVLGQLGNLCICSLTLQYFQGSKDPMAEGAVGKGSPVTSTPLTSDVLNSVSTTGFSD